MAQMVAATRRTLAGRGIELKCTLEDGRQIDKFGGRCARVSSAVAPFDTIQALRRWSSQGSSEVYALRQGGNALPEPKPSLQSAAPADLPDEPAGEALQRKPQRAGSAASGGVG